MAHSPLTDAVCKSAKSQEKDYSIPDGRGLYLFVTTKGKKIFRAAYRLDGVQKTAVFGEYPIISVKGARELHTALRTQLHNKVDPKAGAKPAEKAMTLSEGIQAYWGVKKMAERDAKTVKNAMGGLKAHIEPYLGNKPMNSITMPMMLEVLMKMDKAGLAVYVRKCRGWAGQVFEWGILNSHCVINPARMIDPEIAFVKNEVKNFPSVALDEVPELLARLDMERLQPALLASKMLALTWVRTNELRLMRWEQIEGTMWRIPAKQMKGKKGSKREHLVPLSRQALETLDTLKAMCRASDYVFPAALRTDRTITENCITDLYERIGYKGRMCGHGWRSIGSTWANSQFYDKVVKRFDKQYVEMQLAHIKPGVQGLYDSSEYYPQRQIMLQEYADWLDDAYARGLKGREPPAHSLL